MTDETATRRALSRYVWTAAMELRFASRRLPGSIRGAAVVVVWSAVAIFLGLIVGMAAVVLPPTGAFGIVALAGVVLLWVTPDLPITPRRAVRATFFTMLVVDICVPMYYTVQISGLPWISARRLATFALIAPFLLAVSSSSHVRRAIVDRIRYSRLEVICAVGFLFMIFFVNVYIRHAYRNVVVDDRRHSKLVCAVLCCDLYHRRLRGRSSPFASYLHLYHLRRACRRFGVHS